MSQTAVMGSIVVTPDGRSFTVEDITSVPRVAGEGGRQKTLLSGRAISGELCCHGYDLDNCRVVTDARNGSPATRQKGVS
ncbi:MAG: hypothetical protein Q8R08_00195 [bacterium]|nr:hypothetical protein [bacterium]